MLPHLKCYFTLLSRWDLQLFKQPSYIYIYIYIYHHHHHHHHVVPPARISLTISRHFSLSFIASGRTSGLHPVSSHSCCMYVRAGIYIYIYMYMYKHSVVCAKFKNGFKKRHHHHIVLAARISQTLSRHSSLSFIALGRSSGQQPVSSHSCWMYVRAGRPAFARPCVGIHKSTSLMSSSLLLQQCPACLVRLTWIVFVIGGRWPYSWCLVGCCCQGTLRVDHVSSENQYLDIWVVMRK